MRLLGLARSRPASSGANARRRLRRGRWTRSTGSGRRARPSRSSRAGGRGCRPGTRRRASRPTGGGGRRGSRRARTCAGAPRARVRGGRAGGRRTRPVDQVLGQHRRLVVRARDLLDHDAALAVELGGVDLRAPDEVGQQVDRLGGHLGAAGDVERDQVVRRVGVQDRAHRLGRLVDLAVVVVLLAALEHQMLKKMGHSVLFRALGPRARVEGHEHRGGAGRQLHAVQRKAVRQGGGLDARHRSSQATAGELASWANLASYSRPPDVWQPQNDICVVAGIATTRIARPPRLIRPPRAR